MVVNHYFFIVGQVLVPGNTLTALLQQLESDTPYSVSVVALYADGEGSAVSDNGKTCESERRKTWSEALCHVFMAHSQDTVPFVQWNVRIYIYLLFNHFSCKGSSLNFRKFNFTTFPTSESISYQIYHQNVWCPILELLPPILTQYFISAPSHGFTNECHCSTLHLCQNISAKKWSQTLFPW